jgi:hypothetical protein
VKRIHREWIARNAGSGFCQTAEHNVPAGENIATYRRWLGEAPATFDRDRLIAELTALGALFEPRTRNHIAIDLPDRKSASSAADLLHTLQEAGHHFFEPGRRS